MQKYKDDWKTTWSVLNGDGNLTWGPDPELVQDGYTEADSVHSIWTTELGAGLRMPRTNYCSPLTRCLVTNTITFSGFPNHAPPENSGIGPPHGMPVPLVTVVVENCREKCGKETPEKRRSKTNIQEMFPHFAIEDGFTELDELWHADKSETDKDVRKRVRNVLDGIFDNKSSGDFISITTHAGFIKAFLEVIKRDSFSMHPGAVLPVIVCRYTDDESDDS
jgi:broad specificity phosphatase PhoE